MAGRRRLRYTGRVIRTTFLVSVLLPGVALAQVSVNQGALDQLKPTATVAPAAASHPPARAEHAARPTSASRRPASREPVAHDSAPHGPARPGHTAAPAKPKPHPVSIAPAPPPAAVLPPPAEPPRSVTPPPPPVPILPDAEGTYAPLQGGVRITFGAGKSDLNPTTANALREIAREVLADPNADLNVFAFAAGAADDPSTSRRLSLSRALTARALLISEGIVSTRIYVRALGVAAGDGPADRVDLLRAGVVAPASVPSPPPAPATPPAAAPRPQAAKP